MKYVVLAAAALAVAPGALGAQTSEEPRTSLDGVYTAGQAETGRLVYQRACSGCHSLDAYTGDKVAGWEGAPLQTLWALLSTTMPQDNPGSLSRSEYAAVLAYILELNGMPPGSEALSTRTSVLRNILFSRRSDP